MRWPPSTLLVFSLKQVTNGTSEITQLIPAQRCSCDQLELQRLLQNQPTLWNMLNQKQSANSCMPHYKLVLCFTNLNSCGREL